MFKLRYAENHPVYGLVLVSACVTDLGDASEKVSGKKVCLLSLHLAVTFIASDLPFIASLIYGGALASWVVHLPLA